MALLPELLLIQRLEDVAFIVRYLECLEKRQVLLPEGLAGVVVCVVVDVLDHPAQLGVRVRKENGRGSVRQSLLIDLRPGGLEAYAYA